MKGRLQVQLSGVGCTGRAGAHEVCERAPADFHDLLHGSPAGVSVTPLIHSTCIRKHVCKSERKNRNGVRGQVRASIVCALGARCLSSSATTAKSHMTTTSLTAYQ